jgi:hypothetical protein
VGWLEENVPPVYREVSFFMHATSIWLAPMQ